MSKIRILLISFFFLHSASAIGQIRLPKLISDGAIFQRDVELKIWGWASPGEQVELLFNGNQYSAQADQKGDWDFSIPPQSAGGPFKMVFEGSNVITLKDILFGDVWVCSGQSNMELTMQRVKDKYPEIIRASGNPQIRQFLVPDKYDFNKEHSDLDGGSWKEANPANIYDFSAVAYFFARELYDKYRVPIGLINAALGGSPVEAWMSEDALKQFPYAYDELQKFKDENLIREIEESDRNRRQSWYDQLNENDEGLAEGSEWYMESTKDEDWEEMKVPGFWANERLGDINGSVWFRKRINVSGQMTGKEARLWLGRIVDQDFVYVNGTFVGTTGYQYPPRKYTIGPAILKEGENVIAVRVVNEQGTGGFVRDKPYFVAVQDDTMDLKGTWKYRLGAEMDPLASQTFVRWKPGGLYNRMISPLLNYNMKGVIWYQGESNANDPARYFKTFPALIGNWRDKWQLGDFPFIYVQLANFMEETDKPTESAWAEVRQAQLNTLSLPNTGMAVTIDLGEWNDIHPLNKQDVGKRLALHASKLAYGDHKIVASSPCPETYKFGDEKVKIKFSDTGSGLMAKDGGPLHYFELSGDGKTYVKASATIQGNNVIVWNPEIINPVSVRYAWANNPQTANLYSKDGLPAGPFQIDKE
jgi:sialate O-acetylesterase